jgi:hypothetical protein
MRAFWFGARWALGVIAVGLIFGCIEIVLERIGQ